MPEKKTLEQARKDARQGKSPSTQAGEFVHEEIKHVREGKHGARSAKQAIAIGLSKARRSGVKLSAPKRDKTSARTRSQAQRDARKGRSGKRRRSSARRAQASRRALKRQPRRAASRVALSRHARSAARSRSRADRKQSARKAARATEGRLATR